MTSIGESVSTIACSVHRHRSRRTYKGYSMKSKKRTFISILIPSSTVTTNGIRPLHFHDDMNRNGRRQIVSWQIECLINHAISLAHEMLIYYTIGARICASMT